ncbi:interferon-induced protein with tetratricopeptide repeats 5-like [Callorhinchus milii]|uniref:interferon-induced protein with tetratricopeptide repeats 5-like n=1 Tax=Callorhinchus milii TaxID=7868 RepID=UPI001C3F59E5|nr:interferon-induced protein with tetratricopeptide repeats 5-like [Callorhinchus milii]
MSNEPEGVLKAKLNDLECHFTWGFQEKEFSLDKMKLKLETLPEDFVQYKAMPYNQLAFVNHLQGDYREALRNLEKAEKILREDHPSEFGRSIVTYGNYAWVYYHRGQLTDAQTYLDKLEDIWSNQFPSRDAAQIPEVCGEKGWSLLNYSIGYYGEAEECFIQALEGDPLDTEWNLGLATVLWRKEAVSGVVGSCENSESVAQLRRVLLLDGNRSMAMMLLALRLQEFDQREEASALVENALRVSSDGSLAIRYAAKFYRKEDDVDKAIALLGRAMESAPHSSFLHHQMGLCYRSKFLTLDKDPVSNIPHAPVFQEKTECIQKSKFHFGKAFEQNPFFTIAKLDFANICVRNREYLEAEQIFTDLLRLESSHDANKQAVYLQYGLFQQNQKKSDSNAASLFLEGLKISKDTRSGKMCRVNLQRIAEKHDNNNSSDSKVFYFVGLMYQLDGETPKAIECLEKATKFDQHNEEYNNALIELCLSMQENNVLT